MKIKEIIYYFESFAPGSLQEDYDNAGLIIGNPETEVSGILISIDSVEETIEEAKQKGANLIIAHHPIVFTGLKKLNGTNYIERTIISAIKNNIAIYAIHTNIDSVLGGVSTKIAEKLNLQNVKILDAKTNYLLKLVYFVPLEHAEITRNAVLEAGAGHIGNYDKCSFNLNGKGSFRAGEGSDPYVGKKGEIHFEDETRIEVVLPKHRLKQVVKSLLESHPYEEVPYDIYLLDNVFQGAGLGIIGDLPIEKSEMEFLDTLKSTFNAKGIRYTKLLNKTVKKVAVCGGSGSFLLSKAISQNADIFVSSDFKYHQFFDADNKILVADIGHYESEQFTKELIYDLLIKKFPKFAIHFTEINTNPINYL